MKQTDLEARRLAAIQTGIATVQSVLGIGLTSWARSAGLSRSAPRDILRGASRKPADITLARLAEAVDLQAGHLTGDAQIPLSRILKRRLARATPRQRRTIQQTLDLSDEALRAFEGGADIPDLDTRAITAASRTLRRYRE